MPAALNRADFLLQLFNATSLREASESSKMGRYVLVFTIATIIYLPPSFIAVSISFPRLIALLER